MAATTSDLIGTVVLGRYRIDGELDSGAMGTVYRGTNLRLDREVAIKVMRDQLAHDRRLIERFKREARVASKLSHPNLISVIVRERWERSRRSGRGGRGCVR